MRIDLPTTAKEECPNCGTIHTCEIEWDDDGAYVAIETTPCSDDHCTGRLCSECPQFKCEFCDLPHCLVHAVMHEGRPICRTCAAELVKESRAELEGVAR